MDRDDMKKGLMCMVFSNLFQARLLTADDDSLKLDTVELLYYMAPYTMV